MKPKIISKIYKNEIKFLPSRESGLLTETNNLKEKPWKKNLKDLIKFKIKATLLVFLSISFILGLSLVTLPKADQVKAAEPLINTTPKEMNTEGIVRFTNIKRKKFKLEELKINENLIKLANSRIEDMQRLNYFAHTNPEGIGLKQFVSKIEYNYLIVGENLSMNYYDNEEVVTAWMNSETHRNNMLRKEFDEIGIAYGDVTINNKKVFIIAMILGKEK